MQVHLFFAWFDFWVGVYYDRRNRRVYILPLPMIGLMLEWGRAAPVVRERQWLWSSSGRFAHKDDGHYLTQDELDDLQGG